jgi:HNH endonuclease
LRPEHIIEYSYTLFLNSYSHRVNNYKIDLFYNYFLLVIMAKVIPSFPRYTINENCEVYDTKNERVVVQGNHKDGYKTVSLVGDDNIRKTHRLIHRLMFEAFGLVEGEIMPDFIDHIDCDKTNNLITNLRPATNQENQRNVKCRSKLGHKNIMLRPNGTYQVKIRITADIRYNKCHKTLQEAIDDATRVRNEHHGVFARHL